MHEFGEVGERVYGKLKYQGRQKSQKMLDRSAFYNTIEDMYRWHTPMIFY